jgi:folate-binding protein YgfZ
MSAAKIARLTDRSVVSVKGRDSKKLLQGLITNDLERLDGAADHTGLHAALLSPQGKIFFDFFVAQTADAYLLEVALAKAGDLVKRLAMYKLRADVTITDASDHFAVFALWGDGAASHGETSQSVHFTDPRDARLGLRILAEAKFADDVVSATTGSNANQAEYDAHRVALGAPEGGKDYEFGDTYPHEADFDLLNGVSFTKGCYVGQEVVARMQNKTVVRKRVVKISASAPLTSGVDVLLGEAPVGHVGTVAGGNALAMLRLDRALEAQQKNHTLTAGGVTITPDTEALVRYRVTAEPSAAIHT